MKRARSRTCVPSSWAWGGFDVLTALYYDAAEVVGVEVNAATLRILKGSHREYFKHWVDDPRVQIVLGEARHHLARDPARYDVLQLSGVDSYSGTPGAAHVFSESYLYTDEAWDLYLSRLTDQGIINMMRLEHRPPREMLRALATAVAALRRAGAAEPAKHVMTLTATNGLFAALLVKKTPFTAEEEQRVARWASGRIHFGLTASPSGNSERTNFYQAFLEMSPGQQRAFLSAYPFDISPVGDNRPFFFKFSRWDHIFKPPAVIPVLEYTLLILFAMVGVAAVVGVGAPLLAFHAGGLRAPHAIRYAAYFAGLGVGFMAVEMALMQKFGLFLGHPNYAVSVVLAALLLFGGLGSLFSQRIVPRAGGPRFVAYAVSAAVLAEYLLVLPRLPQWIGWPAAVRVALVFGLIAPVGVGLGTFFPYALERLKHAAPAFAPWAWGINGIFSVLGPVLSVGVSATWGIDALLLAALPLYLVTAAVLPTSPETA